MTRRTVPIGLLFSRTGSYAAVGEAMLAGAELAVEEANRDPGLSVVLEPHPDRPGWAECGLHGGRARDAGRARRVARDRLLHVVKPQGAAATVRKHDAMLWYPSHYEGFETSDNVIYTGAGPNQHVVPLTRYLLARCGRRGGSWARTTSGPGRTTGSCARRCLARAARCWGERYFPVGETDLGAVVGQILDQRPDFVFSTLIGESAYAFYRTFRKAARRRGLDQARELPVASCSLAEPELARIGAAAEGHLSSSVYFSTVRSERNARFTAAWRARFPELGHTSADAEAAYVAAHLLARALDAAGTTRLQEVRRAAAGLALDAPQGRVWIDPENRHCHLSPRIGRSTTEGTFEILWESAAPVRPDPYLVWEPGVAEVAPRAGSGLKAVS
jgi:branched-chain amino acid transport system substrate-binding protein